jgi:hypothetical protein
VRSFRLEHRVAAPTGFRELLAVEFQRVARLLCPPKSSRSGHFRAFSRRLAWRVPLLFLTYNRMLADGR